MAACAESSSGYWRFDGEIIEECLHIDTDSFVVAVDAGPVRGFASHARAAQPGEDRGDDLVAEGEQGGDRACGASVTRSRIMPTFRG